MSKYSDVLDWILEIQEQSNYEFSEDEYNVIQELENELRLDVSCVNDMDLRKLYNKVQRIVFKYSEDNEDLDDLIGY